MSVGLESLTVDTGDGWTVAFREAGQLNPVQGSETIYTYEISGPTGKMPGKLVVPGKIVDSGAGFVKAELTAAAKSVTQDPKTAWLGGF